MTVRGTRSIRTAQQYSTEQNRKEQNERTEDKNRSDKITRAEVSKRVKAVRKTAVWQDTLAMLFRHLYFYFIIVL